MSSSLLLDRAHPKAGTRLPLLAKGFRPFFLLAASYAIAIVPLWLAVLQGAAAPVRYLDPAVWHAHEMLSGFATAVIAGFLLTAASNWTQRETATGASLGLLAAVWAAGRLAMLFSSSLPRALTAAVDLAFIPLLMVALGRPLISTGNRRNFVMLGVLTALFVANLIVHLEGLGILVAGAARRANLAAVDLVALLILIIGGRVFPMFTRNATGVSSIRSVPWLDRACIGSMIALCIVDAFVSREGHGARTFAGLTGILALARALHWGALHTRRDPLLWILHTGYLWLVLGLLLRGGGAWIGLPFESMATHAITVGAIGSLTLGMMARVSLGHTGRMLAAPRSMTIAFVAITVAAVARVLAPWAAPALYREALVATGVCWTLAFGIFLVEYAPMLVRSRVDGRPG